MKLNGYQKMMAYVATLVSMNYLGQEKISDWGDWTAGIGTGFLAVAIGAFAIDLLRG